MIYRRVTFVQKSATDDAIDERLCACSVHLCLISILILMRPGGDEADAIIACSVGLPDFGHFWSSPQSFAPLLPSSDFVYQLRNDG